MPKICTLATMALRRAKILLEGRCNPAFQTPVGSGIRLLSTSASSSRSQGYAGEAASEVVCPQPCLQQRRHMAAPKQKVWPALLQHWTPKYLSSQTACYLQVSPHRRGMRNANKFIRRVPVVAQCRFARENMPLLPGSICTSGLTWSCLTGPAGRYCSRQRSARSAQQHA